MPEKSGSELIGDLLRDFSSVKVVAMSGVVGDVSGLLREAVDAGALQTLRKPFTTGQLLDAIQRAVGP
jgi:FixJ family two-component response regulator